MTADLDTSRRSGSPRRAGMDGWTLAHSEAGWFIGGCSAVVAVLGSGSSQDGRAT